MRSEVWGNIVLVGSSTMFKGMADRLKREIEDFDTQGATVIIEALEDRQNLAWKGASIKPQERGFDHVMVSKSEYEENCAAFAHRRCY
ncbi:hypothetical protein G7Y89_g1889 [Cudoniella acicularis]|uniref:Uncharacterized protein n=1 Tax=Cudoniella acicularis TaxID=354080 RepID=A0A8H4RXA6_9HELO|nr:hypothetical protein G7Y89_g1889 [Cudoniella acicularis]